jgi:hypothetical protein
MDGIIWLFLALTVALVAFGVVLPGRRRLPSGVDPNLSHCSSCQTPMSLRRRSLLGEWSWRKSQVKSFIKSLNERMRDSFKSK